MALGHMPRKWGQRKWAMAVTHQERWAMVVTLHDILATRLSGQQLLYLRGSRGVLPHNMLSGV